MRFEEYHTRYDGWKIFDFPFYIFGLCFPLDDHCHYLHCSELAVHDAAILA